MITMKSREFFVCVLLQCAIRKAYIIKNKKRSPINSKAEGKKKGWPGEIKVLEKGTKQGEGAKKSAHGRCLVSCSGTLLLLDDDVVDKLFGF